MDTEYRGGASHQEDNLIRLVSALEAGLNTHFGYEEKYLPPIFGDYLMKALLYEHNKVRQQIGVAKKTVHETKIDNIDRQSLFHHKTLVQDCVGRLLQTIEDHAGHEEIILLMIKSGLEGSREPAR